MTIPPTDLRCQVLVLSRLLGEKIIIGDSIVVTVMDIRSGKVRLGIEAPEWVPIHRKEVVDKIERQQTEATGPDEIPAGVRTPGQRIPPRE